MMFGLLGIGCILFDDGNIPTSCDEVGCELKSVNLRISPQNPIVSDVVRCVSEPPIPEEHIEFYRWELNDGTPVAQVQNISLTPNVFNKGDEIVCSIHLRVPMYEESSYEARATIVNAPPVLSSVGISPAVPVLEYDGLFCNPSMTDIDGDTLNQSISWRLNGNAFEDVQADGSIALQYLNAGDTWRCKVELDDGETSVSMESEPYTVVQHFDFQMIPAQTMTLGSDNDELGHQVDESQRQVSLTQRFFMMQTEFTENMYAALTGDVLESTCWDCPLTDLNWHEAASLANMLSDRYFVERCYFCETTNDTLNCQPSINPYSCQGYRLPTEAEWEIAARSGSGTAFYYGDLVDDIYSCQSNQLDAGIPLNAFAWFCGNSSMAQPVGRKLSNDYQLFDMHGNVWEWTTDSYGVWGSQSITDPYVFNNNSRVLKGGSYEDASVDLRSASRRNVMDFERDQNIGFRFVYVVE